MYLYISISISSYQDYTSSDFRRSIKKLFSDWFPFDFFLGQQGWGHPMLLGLGRM